MLFYYSKVDSAFKTFIGGIFWLSLSIVLFVFTDYGWLGFLAFGVTAPLSIIDAYRIHKGKLPWLFVPPKSSYIYSKDQKALHTVLSHIGLMDDIYGWEPDPVAFKTELIEVEGQDVYDKVKAFWVVQSSNLTVREIVSFVKARTLSEVEALNKFIAAEDSARLSKKRELKLSDDEAGPWNLNSSLFDSYVAEWESLANV